MTTTRPFTCDDLFRFNMVNLDHLTETYGHDFYFRYFINWPQYCIVNSAPDGTVMSYILGKSEGEGKLWHAHVSAVTVAPQFRRLGLAKTLMRELERIGNEEDCYFVDLFVRKSNSLAIEMYEKFGYTAYRCVDKYYRDIDDAEDAFDMRKPLDADPDGESLQCRKFVIKPRELEFF